MDLIDVRSLEAFVMDQINSDVFAMKLLNAKSDLVI